ncbi:MAG: PKD domain-containing protein, partial [Pirellulales bacterium]
MRLPWITPRSSSRGRTRRKRGAPLKVRRLERRRVLDAAVSELVLAPTDLDGATEVHDTNEGTTINASATATGFGDLFYEWTLRKDGAIVEKGYDTTYSYTPQDDGNYSITLKVTDSTQSSASQTQDILVHNVRPELTVAPNQTVNEGALLNLSAMGPTPLGSFTDAGVLDTHNATIDWGDGSPTQSQSFAATPGGVTLGGMHTYTDSGNYTVTVTVTDDDGGSDTKTFSVLVGNVKPTATVTNSGPVDEGSSATVTISNPQDSSAADTAAGFRYAYDLNNDGTFDVGNGTYAGSVTNNVQMVSAALLADGPATRTVKARIIDKDGGFTDYTTDITVNNVAPKLTNIVIEDSTIEEGDTAKITMNIDDPGATDVFSVEVNWQDGPANTITGLGLSNAMGVVGSTSYQWDAQSRQLTVRHLYLDDNPT